MSRAERLSWAVARHARSLPPGTAFTATSCATLGVMLAQSLFGSRLSLCGRGGAYDLAGILSLHARHWLFNRRPHAHVTLPGVFDTQSEPHVLMATPAQVDGHANANLSGTGNAARPRVAFGGTRGLPDARTVFFVLPGHSARQLVGKVDFVSTCAANREHAPLLITDLVVMRWMKDAGCWRLEEISPETTADAVREKTGFEFSLSPDCRTMEEMPPAARALLARFDPLGMRELDFIAGRKEQLDAFARIYEAEAELVGKDRIPARAR